MTGRFVVINEKIPHRCLGKNICKSEEFSLAKNNLKLETKEYLKNIIEKCLTDEQTRIIGAYRSQRNMLRVDYRNGYYTRSLETSYGTIENLKVPRNRLTKWFFS